MAKTRISRERLEEAIRSTDGSMLEVSKYLNEPPRRVLFNLEHFRIKIETKKTKPDRSEVQALLEVYELGDVAVLLGTSYNTLYRFVTRNGLIWKAGGGT